jgi:hypothetical protein
MTQDDKTHRSSPNGTDLRTRFSRRAALASPQKAPENQPQKRRGHRDGAEVNMPFSSVFSASLW